MKKTIASWQAFPTSAQRSRFRRALVVLRARIQLPPSLPFVHRPRRLKSIGSDRRRFRALFKSGAGSCCSRHSLTWKMANLCYVALETLDIGEVGQLLTSQIPNCSTASEDESGFMRWTDESIKLLIVLPAAMFSLHRTRISLVMTIPSSYRVSTKKGWKGVLLGNLDRFNLNRLRLTRLIPIEMRRK